MVCSTGDLSSFGVDFFEKFDVVVINCCLLAAKVYPLSCYFLGG